MKNAKKSKSAGKTVKTKDNVKKTVKRGVEEILQEGGVLSRIIIEIQGAPKEHIKNTMKLVIDKLNLEENVSSVCENEVMEIIDQKGVFSAFTEFEIAFDDLPKLIGFCFDYAPTSIEILEPAHFSFQSNVLSDLLNDVVNQIHQHAGVIRTITAENKILKYNASAFLRNILVIALSQKERNINELSKITGIKEKELEPILKELISRNDLSYKDKKYYLAVKK